MSYRRITGIASAIIMTLIGTSSSYGLPKIDLSVVDSSLYFEELVDDYDTNYPHVDWIVSDHNLIDQPQFEFSFTFSSGSVYSESLYLELPYYYYYPVENTDKVLSLHRLPVDLQDSIVVMSAGYVTELEHHEISSVNDVLTNVTFESSDTSSRQFPWVFNAPQFDDSNILFLSLTAPPPYQEVSSNGYLAQIPVPTPPDFEIAPVPEPSVYGLMIMGVTVLRLVGRFNKK